MVDPQSRTPLPNPQSQSVADNDRRFRALAVGGPDLVTEVGEEGHFIYVSPNHADILGRHPEELLGQHYLDGVHPNDIDSVSAAYREANRGTPVQASCRIRHLSDFAKSHRQQQSRPHGVNEKLETHDRELFIDISFSPVRSEDGDIGSIIAVYRDISERIKSENQRRRFRERMERAQRLESLGVLAGGIAHDFSNLLTGIQGNARLALMDLDSHQPSRAMLKDIELASERAEELTRELLAYAGKGKFSLQVLNLSELAREMVHLLQVSAPENAKFDFKAKEEPNWINGDGSQIRQVLINLITNATESLEAQRGTITVNTGIAKLNHAVVASSSATADLLDGEYAYVEVSDTGCGMAPAVQERIFEPFFTTKFQGRGLGLAAAQGIVHSHHGTIRVMSTVPTGTTIRVLFPSIPTPGDVVSATRPNAAGSRSGTVLIIDDERFVLNVAKRMLERSGYQVLAAGGGEAGVRIFQEHQNEVGAVLLDATMPGMDGEATFHALRGICHDLPVIFFTAHCETDMASLLSGKHDTTLLQKPFTLAALTNKVQEVIRVVGDG